MAARLTVAVRLMGPEGVLVVDPLTAPLVQEIFTMYDEGKTISEITKSLNQRGLKTRKGFDFRIGSVSLILKNRKYIGEYRYQDVVIPNGVPALVDEELFNRAQEKLVKNKQVVVIQTNQIFIILYQIMNIHHMKIQ